MVQITGESFLVVTTSVAMGRYYRLHLRNLTRDLYSDAIISFFASSKKWQMVHIIGESVFGGDNECGNRQAD